MQWLSHRFMPRNTSSAFYRPSILAPAYSTRMPCWCWPELETWPAPPSRHAQLFERLQAAHKHYRELFDDSVDPIFVTDWDGKIHEANRQAAIISGYTSKQLQGMLIEKLHDVTRGDRNVDIEKLKAGATMSYEAVLKSSTGRAIPIQVQVRRVVFEEAESLQWLMRDITERKDLDTLREDMLSMIYHDLRSPLANIVSSLDVIDCHGFRPG